jgi:6-pyruvoyltetrahydropterin/6-carboxytetrahydropterin synthase
MIAKYEKCGRLHGHTYAVHAKVVGEPDEKGIIIDFSLLKEVLKETVKDLDHKILIPEKSSFITIEKEDDSIKLTSFKKHYVLPLEDCIFLPIDSTSAENLARYVLGRVLEKISPLKQVKSIEIGVDEGFGQGARITKTFER